MDRRHSPTDDLQELRAVFSTDSGLSAPERAVMAVLILHRNGESGRCDPSVTRIAQEAGLGRRTVIRVLGDLEGRWVERQQQAGVRTRYTIQQPAHRCQGGTSATDAPVPEMHGTGATDAPDRCQSGTQTNEVTNEERTKGRKHLLPDDWQPTDSHVRKAKELGVDLDHEAEKFRAHAEANDRKLVRWNAGFTQWLLTAKEYQQRNGQGKSKDAADTLMMSPAEVRR